MTVTDGQNGTPVAGATVGGQVTGPDGGATLTFTTTGVHPLKAESPDSVRSNTVGRLRARRRRRRVRVGTGRGRRRRRGAPQALDSTGPTARITGIRRGQRFTARRAPRLLKGTVGVDPSGVKAV